MLSLKLSFLFLSIALLSREAVGEWRWAGKVAVVTGASSGIGAEIAVALAEKGVIVVGLARREERIEELKTRTNGTIHAIKCDLLDEEDVIKAFQWVEKKLGGVDILVNNAGAFKIGSLVSGETKDWKYMMDLNVISMSICSREALKTMRTRGDDGHIINMNSVAGHKVPKVKIIPSGIYSASKFAVTALSESLAYELAELSSKVKVTSISPGVVATELVFNLTKEFAKLNPPAQTPSLPYIEPSDVADGVLYVLSTRPNVQIPELSIQPIANPA